MNKTTKPTTEPTINWSILLRKLVLEKIIFLLIAPFIFYQCAQNGRNELQVKKWHTLELEFQGPELSESSTENPFLDYRMNVVFECEEVYYEVPGFYAADGNAAETSASSGNKWKVRFTPDHIGEWTYKVSFRKGKDIAINNHPTEGEPAFFDGEHGKFTVVASDKTGKDFRSKGRLNYVGERYLQFAETKEYYLKGGADSPENFLAYEDFDNTYSQRGPENSMKSYQQHIPEWHAGDPVWKENKGKGIIGALNYLSSKGMNSVYFLTMNINGDGRDVWPYVDYKDFTRFDCSKLDQWEIVFSHMDSLGLMLHVVTQETENELLLDNGDVSKYRKLYYRELIARFSHHLAITWNLGEENGINNGNPTGQSDEQRRNMASYFKTHDPYQHFVVVHTWSRQEDRDKIYKPLLGFEHLDGPSLQVGDVNNVHSSTLKWINLSAETGKQWVAFLDENGPADFGAAPDEFDANHDTIRHKVLWGNLMAGGAGVEWYFGYKYPNADLSCEDWHSRDNLWDQTKVALDIFNEYLPFNKMSSHDELVTGNAYCFAQPDEIYALYLFDTIKVRIYLGNGNSQYNITWLNPNTGEVIHSESPVKIVGPGWVDVEAPKEKQYDYLAIIRKH
ncbi:MAG: DUF5060 domain-containing protein [Prolixibacteraceae bacterium]